MNHTDHVNLLRDGISVSGGTWADFGSGRGAFTLALAERLGPGGEIYSVDKDRGTLRTQERAMHSRFPRTTVHYLTADFTRPLDFTRAGRHRVGQRSSTFSVMEINGRPSNYSEAIFGPMDASFLSSMTWTGATCGCHIRSLINGGENWLVNVDLLTPNY